MVLQPKAVNLAVRLWYYNPTQWAWLRLRKHCIIWLPSQPHVINVFHQLSSRPTKDFDNRSSSASEFDSAIVERPQDRHEEEFEEEDEEEEDVLWDFRDTDRLEETPKPMVQNNKTGTKKFPKYQIRHQSLQPSAEDAKHFSVDKDQLGR